MMKTQYIKPEIQMVLLENMLMASNSKSWAVDYASNVNDPKNNDHGPIYGPYDDWKPNFNTDPFDSDNW